ARLSRIFAKRAVGAIVAAQRRQRNKNLLREGDRLALSLLAHLARCSQQFVERHWLWLPVAASQHQRLFATHTLPSPRLFQRRLGLCAGNPFHHLRSRLYWSGNRGAARPLRRMRLFFGAGQVQGTEECKDKSAGAQEEGGLT